MLNPICVQLHVRDHFTGAHKILSTKTVDADKENLLSFSVDEFEDVSAFISPYVVCLLAKSVNFIPSLVSVSNGKLLTVKFK